MVVPGGMVAAKMRRWIAILGGLLLAMLAAALYVSFYVYRAVSSKPFFGLVQLGDLARVQEVLKQSPRLARAAGMGGETALHRAAVFGRVDVAALLLDRGANLSARTALTGETPLHKAAINGHRETAALLIARGAEVNARNKFQRTPLTLALRSGHTETAHLLRERGGEE